jgi:Ser-tRNA(Ala) deacylase AlaX
VYDAPEGTFKGEGAYSAIVLDRSIFHPQGGGQPNDEGFIKHRDHDFKFIISNLVIKSDVILHIGTFEPAEGKASFEKGSAVQCNVDEAKRRQYAKTHSAGHLLDIAMTRAGRPDLRPSKGYHFATGAYVEYLGEVPEPDRKPLIA